MRAAQWLDQSVADSLVVPFQMIVRDELSNQLPQVPLTQRDHFAQALVTNRANESFGVCIQVRTSRWKSPYLRQPISVLP